MNNLIRLIGNRLIALPIMIFGVTILVFFLMSFSPIDPAYSALGEGASQEALNAYRESHGLNDPWIVQYANFMLGFFQGDLGTYGANEASVGAKIAEALPITLQLTLFGLIIAVAVAVILGVISAVYRDKWPDQIIRVFSIACIAMPSFWLAVLLILLFTVTLNNMLPAAGPLPDLFQNPSGYFALTVDHALVEELDKDYVRTAIGAGIPRRVVIAKNVLRNALITPVTVLGLRIGYLIGGAVVIEVIFNLPGMGMTIVNGVTSNYPTLVQGVTLTVALTFIIINVVIDMLYILIDPRIRSV